MPVNGSAPRPDLDHANGRTKLTVLLRIGGALLSGVLLAFSYSLHPVWPAAWVAPIPLLFALVGVRWPAGLGLGALTGVVASVSLLDYMIGLSGVFDGVLISALRIVQWGVIALVARVAMLRLPRPIGIFVFPALLAGLEVLIAALSPHGSGGSIAYSQMDVLAVIQVASLGGTAAIVFLLGLFANIMVFAVVDWRAGWGSGWRALLAPVVILALALGFSGARLAQAPAETGLKVAMIATNAFTGVPEDWRTVWRAYAPAVAAAAGQHAQIVVLPEKLFRIDADDIDELLGDVRRPALANGIDLVIGVDGRDPDRDRRRAFSGTCPHRLFRHR